MKIFNVKFYFCIFFLFFSINSNSNELEIILPVPPGGGIDSYTQIFRKYASKSIKIEYRSGAFGIQALNYLRHKKNSIIISNPSIISPKSPNKNMDIELLDVLCVVDKFLIVQKNSSLSVRDLIDENITIGVPNIGSPHHLLALQLRSVNSKAEIVAFKGDNEALPALIGGDLNVYIVSATVYKNWKNNFPIKSILHVPFDQEIVLQNIKFKNVSWVGFFVHTDITLREKNDIIRLINEIKDNKKWEEEMIYQGVRSIKNINVKKLFDDYQKEILKYDF